MVDTRDLKSLGPKRPCGFDSRPRHLLFFHAPRTYRVTETAHIVTGHVLEDRARHAGATQRDRPCPSWLASPISFPQGTSHYE